MSVAVLGPPKGYVDMLDEATEAASLAESKEASDYHPLRPSSAGKCTRELAYELSEYVGQTPPDKDPKNAETVRIFNLGHHVEKHLIYQFEDNLPQFKLRYKQQIVTFFNLKATTHPEWSHTVEGSLDACFWSPETRGVTDFKSKKDRFSAFYRTNWDETTEKLKTMPTVTAVSDTFFYVDNLVTFLADLADPFFAMNFEQLNGYACTEFLKSRNVDHASIIQSNKNDSRLREVRFRPSDEVFEKTRKKFQTALDAVDAGNPELAPKDYVLGSIKCAYCDQRKRCWPSKDATKAFYATFPQKVWPRDTDRMGNVGDGFEKLFDIYRSQDKATNDKKVTEAAILKLMMEQKVNKIRIDNGEVYEARELKDSVVLRRTKA